MSATPPLIRLDQVSKSYHLGELEVVALRDVSLEIDDGELVAVMGASGSGKSTLMNILGCLDRPSGGRYLLNGVEMSGAGANARAEVRNRSIGFVFQSFNLLARTSAVENVELPLLYAGVPARTRHERARAALEQVGLADRLDHHPNQMSGGQQQRVAIARALVTRPRLVLADEPTGNLDSQTSLEVMRLLVEMSRGGITVVLVTHEAEIGAYAERVVSMRDGQLVGDERRAPMPLPTQGATA